MSSLSRELRQDKKLTVTYTNTKIWMVLANRGKKSQLTER